MADDIRVRYGPTEDRENEIIPLGMLGWDTDLNQLYVGDGDTAGGILVGGGGFSPQFKTQAASTADTVTVYFYPKTTGNTLRVTISTGTGTFTKPIILSRETRAEGAGSGAAVAAGTTLEVSVICETTSASREIQICDNATGNILDTITSDTDGTFSALLKFVYSGTQWLKTASSRQ